MIQKIGFEKKEKEMKESLMRFLFFRIWPKPSFFQGKFCQGCVFLVLAFFQFFGYIKVNHPC